MRNETGSAATQRGLWRDAYLEFLKPGTISVASVTIALFVVAMTIFGPLGTSETFTPLPRLLYWGSSAAVTFPLCYAMAAAVLYVMRSRSLVETVPAVAAAVLFEGMMCTAAVHTADTLFRPEYAGAVSMGAIFVTVTAVVAVCTFFVHYIVFQRIRREGAASAEDHRNDAPAAADNGTASATGGVGRGDAAAGSNGAPTARQERFYRRLSRAVSRDIIYLKVEDHYVEVHTTGGSCLVLMSFRNAVADLGDLGLQVHRSFWVARRHVTGTVRRDGRTMVRVTGGHLVPVSRTYLPAVRDALREAEE